MRIKHTDGRIENLTGWRAARYLALCVLGVGLAACSSSGSPTAANDPTPPKPPKFEEPPTPSAVASGSGSIAVLTLGADGNDVTNAYVPLPPNFEGFGQIAIVQIDPVVAKPRVGTILLDRKGSDSACAANPKNGLIVCIDFESGNADIIDALESEHIATIALPIGKAVQFSGGDCMLCSVGIDSERNLAVIGSTDGMHVIDLESRTVARSIAAKPSENIGIHEAAGWVFLPHYQRQKDGSFTSELTVFDLDQGAAYAMQAGFTEPDAVAADTATGIVAVADEEACELHFINMNDATFDGASGVSAPVTVLKVTDPACGSQEESGARNWLTTGVAIETGSHLAFLEAEFGDMVGVIGLPQQSISGAVALDTLSPRVAAMPRRPDGKAWINPGDPHGLAVWADPETGKPFGILINEGGTYIAKIDLQAFRSAPAVKGNRVDISSGVVTYLSTL